MKKEMIFKSIKISSVVLSLLNLLMYFSMRCCWSGISKTLGYEKEYSPFLLHLPVILLFVFLAIAITSILLFLLMKKEKRLWSFILLPINIALTIGVIVIIVMGAIDYMYFIVPEFFKSVGILIISLILIFFIFFYHKTKLKDSKIFKFSLLTCIILGTIGYLVNFSINRITYRPVVYAVEDTYQIVFSSSSDALGWVEINGEKYHQTSAGSQTSYTKVHKVTIPMDILDEAKSYSIHVQKLIYRGPFGGIKGREISQEYSFRPVNSKDGINYYNLSDIHMGYDAALKAASYHSDMEFLVINGDTISLVETYDDAQYINKVAFGITKGEIPVIHARGNHEIKGKYAEKYYQFVGSKNEKFYFNFYLDGIYGIVLDIGEDHDDDWWEYYGTANFEDYQKEQIEFLKDEIAVENYKKYDYRMVVCHIPIPFVNSRKNHEQTKKDLTALLNQMDIDMSLTAHQHELMIFEPNVVTPFETLTYNTDYKKGKNKGYLTDFNFPNLMISKRGLTQTDSNKLTNNKEHIGLAINVDFETNKQTAIYNNVNGENIKVVNPFADIDYGTEIEISLETKKFS